MALESEIEDPMARDEQFSHGDFWDSYSREWEKRYAETYAKSGGVLGEEWGPDQEAQAHVEEFLLPYVGSGARVLELGPGGGKYTRHLAQKFPDLVLADVSQEMLDRALRVCNPKPRTVLTNGVDLLPLTDASFEAVFSFDVLIHVDPEELIRYLAEFNRILKPDGVLVMTTGLPSSVYGQLAMFRQIRDHSGLIGKRWGGKLFPMDPVRLRTYAELSGFEVVRIQESWEHSVGFYVFRRRGPAYFWRFATDSALRTKLEVAGRVGGSDGISVCVGGLPGHASPTTFLLGHAHRLTAMSTFKNSALRSIASPSESGSSGDMGWAVFPLVRGLSWNRMRKLMSERSPQVSQYAWKLLHGADVLRDAVAAAQKGHIHPLLNSEWMIYHCNEDRFLTLGWAMSGSLDEQQQTARAITGLAAELRQDALVLGGLSEASLPPCVDGDLRSVNALAEAMVGAS